MISQQRQNGLSIVELLVALAISSFLILGITQIYIGNKKSYLFQQGQAENNESVRFLTHILDRELQKIGYRRRPDLAFETVFKSEDGFLVAGQTIKPVSDNEIKFRYQYNSDRDYGCEGQSYSDLYPGASAATEINEMYENEDAPSRVVELKFDSATGVLKCNGQEIVSGIASFKFLYAIPIDRTDSNRGLKHVEFDELTSTDRIKGIRYQALVASTMKSLSDFKGSKAVDVLFENDEDKPTDSALYQFVTKTVMLRNLMSW